MTIDNLKLGYKSDQRTVKYNVDWLGRFRIDTRTASQQHGFKVRRVWLQWHISFSVGLHERGPFIR